MTTEISIIIVNFNAEPYLRPCLDSVINQGGENETEIIVVDNHSQDESITILRREYPQVTLLENLANLGFAKACNQAARIAQGRYLFFLNPDTKLAPDCLKTLLHLAKDQTGQDFILIPQQVSYDGTRFVSQGLAVDIFGYPNTAYSPDGARLVRPIFYADGAALFLPTATFVKLGMFDENYFMYQEDIDLSWKAHLMQVPLIPVKEAIVHHKVGAIAGGGSEKEKSYTTSYLRRYQVEKNLLSNLIKNYSLPSLAWILPLYFFLNLLEFFLFLLLLKPKTSFVYPQAYWRNLKKLASILKKRKWIQKQRLVSDRAILAKMVKIPSKFFLLARAGIPKIKG